MDIFNLVLVLTFFFFRCLPGIFLGFLGWLLTGRMANKWAQVIIRGLLVALAITPTAAGHAGFIPAVWLFLLYYPDLRSASSDRLVHGVLPLLIVWSLAIPMIYFLTASTGKRVRSPWI
jgi:hypothetical protein